MTYKPQLSYAAYTSFCFSTLRNQPDAIFRKCKTMNNKTFRVINIFASIAITCSTLLSVTTFAADANSTNDILTADIQPSEDTTVTNIQFSETTITDSQPSEETTITDIQPPEETTITDIQPLEETAITDIQPPEETTITDIQPPDETTITDIQPPDETTVTDIQPPDETTITDIQPPKDAASTNTVKPEPPTDLTTSNITGNSVKLTWQSVTPHNAERWLIQYRPQGGSWTNSGVAWYKSYTVTGLTAFTTYEFRVYAEAGSPAWSGTRSKVSNIATAKTLPAQPTNLKFTSRTESTVTLAWETETPHNAERWLILYRATGTSAWQRSGVAWYKSFTVDGLTPYSEYDFIVYAEAGEKWNGTRSLPSNTLSQYTLPAQPTNLRTLNVTGESVELFWATATPHNAERWLIQYSTDGAGWINAATTWSKSYKFTNLTPTTQYYFRVYSEAGGSAWKGTRSIASNTVTIKTLPATPTNLTITDISSTSIRITWETVTPHNTERWLIRQRIGTNGWTNLGVTWSKSYTITGLKPGTAYAFQVYGEVGSPAWSGTRSKPSKFAGAKTPPYDLSASKLQKEFFEATGGGDYDGVAGLQCVDLYVWFIRNHTTLEAKPKNGKDCADSLSDLNNLPTSNTPTAFSIFSTSKYKTFGCFDTDSGHVGLVLSVDTENKECFVLHTGSKYQGQEPNSFTSTYSYSGNGDVTFVDVSRFLK